MMNINIIATTIIGMAAQSASGQSPEPDVSTLAQALDRCMTTYAVRFTKTELADEAIYIAAVEGCKQIEIDLTAAVKRDIPAAKGEAAITQWQEQAKPNFMTLLQRIRTDRAARGGQ